LQSHTGLGDDVSAFRRISVGNSRQWLSSIGGNPADSGLIYSTRTARVAGIGVAY
jgi:hypothetical protein